ncbi:unnamed protein product [Dibothriocephalus latus]|uniref:UTP--glucose-1-phosphate uridylyltransferase n=1 Tax=Dibothriocephalus latus TaxID=60516 RepID=A0A3P7KXB4_DIBLA|nr:unnamed protein product [Dibothriocephalus latus]
MEVVLGPSVFGFRCWRRGWIKLSWSAPTDRHACRSTMRDIIEAGKISHDRSRNKYKYLRTLNSRYGIEVPLVLMNSFNTQRDTDSYLRKISKRDLKIFTFEQNRFPRLLEETSLPFAKSMQLKQDYDPAWYPPGHGDLYRCFYESGLLKKFINEGKTWAFVSNIDNLGATADPTILCYLEEQRKNKTSKQADFVMEVTPKTLSDIKGGTLVRYKERLRLLEVAQASHYIDSLYLPILTMSPYAPAKIMMGTNVEVLYVKDSSGPLRLLESAQASPYIDFSLITYFGQAPYTSKQILIGRQFRIFVLSPNINSYRVKSSPILSGKPFFQASLLRRHKDLRIACWKMRTPTSATLSPVTRAIKHCSADVACLCCALFRC